MATMYNLFTLACIHISVYNHIYLNIYLAIREQNGGMNFPNPLLLHVTFYPLIISNYVLYSSVLLYVVILFNVAVG